MLSDPCFNRRFVFHHRRRNEALGEPPLLLPSDDPLSSILSFLPVPDKIRSKFSILDSFRDLLLCGFREPGGKLGRLFFICNPFTKQWVALPSAPKRLSYEGLAPVEAKLVCEPCNSNILDLGDGQAYKYSEYRFRVLLEYRSEPRMVPNGPKLFVFSSSSRKWKEKDPFHSDLTSLNGKLYWENRAGEIVECNPFRLKKSPTTISNAEISSRPWRSSYISASQGALHVTLLEADRTREYVFRVWRWEGGRTWSVRYELFLLDTLAMCDSDFEVNDLRNFTVVVQHPERTRKLELVDDEVKYDYSNNWMVFQPKVTCFSVVIANYEKLLDMYKGKYGCLVQRNGEGNDGKDSLR